MRQLSKSGKWSEPQEHVWASDKATRGRGTFFPHPLHSDFLLRAALIWLLMTPPKWRACSQAWLLIDLHWIQTKSNLVVLYLCAPWSSLPSFLPPLLLPLFFLHFPPKQTEQQVIRAKSYKLKHSPLLNNHKGNGQLFVKSTALLPLLSSKRECYRSKLSGLSLRFQVAG